MSPSLHLEARLGRFLSVAALALATLVAPATEGQLAVVERAAGHERLDFLLGEWSHQEVQTILGRETAVSSTTRYAWLPGDTWLRGEATIRGLPGIDVLHGWLQITYDAATNEVVELWSDNQSSLLFTKRGSWQDETTLVTEGSHLWNGETIHSRNVYRLLSENEFSREYLVSSDGGASYRRRSLARLQRQRPTASDAAPERPGNEAFDALAWLVGDWLAQFRPLGEDRAAPTMAFAWGDPQRSFLRMTGTQPTADGGLEPEYESFLVWHPVRRKHAFVGVYRSTAGRIVEDGDVDLLADGGVRLNMRVHYPAGATLPFSAGRTAGPQGHTLEFRRTFYREGDDGLRGVFRIRRGDAWENPHPELKMDDGYPWKRIGPGAPS